MPLTQAYNDKASIYEQVVQKRGQPLREGFTVVKVRAVRLASPRLALGDACLIWQPRTTVAIFGNLTPSACWSPCGWAMHAHLV